MKLFLSVITIIAPSLSLACSCLYDRDMKEVARKSPVIFYGEVISVEKIGKIVPSGNEQEYQITVYPRRVFKGKPHKEYKFKGFNFYNESDTEVVIGGCGLDMELGSNYVIMIEENSEIEWSWCSEHILPKGTKKYKYFMRKIREKL